MNISKVKKDFTNKLKGMDVRIITRLNDGQLCVCDTCYIAFIDDNSPIIDSRAVFPKIPKVGEGFMYRGDNEQKTPRVQEVVDNAVNNPDLKKFTATPWSHGDSVMLECGDERIFINRCFLNLLPIKGEFEPHLGYQFFGTTPENHVIVKNHKDKIEFIFMPVRVCDDMNRVLPDMSKEAA